MVRISLEGPWAHKRRLASTFIAVFLGVAFLSGTLVLGDTLSSNFDTLFSSVSSGTSAVVRGSTAVKGTRAIPQRNPISADLVSRIASQPGVADAAANVQGFRGAPRR